MSIRQLNILILLFFCVSCVPDESVQIQQSTQLTKAVSSSGQYVEIGIDCTSPSIGTIDEMIFGSFTEMHGGDHVPGILEQYIVNTSFEQWIDSGERGESKNELVFTGDNAVIDDADVAYPWEKRVISGSPTVSVSSVQYRNTARSQRVAVSQGSSAAILQKLALPIYRISTYKLEFYAKVTTANIPSISVSFHGEGTKESTVLSDVFTLDIPTDGKWHKYVHVFTLESSTNKFNNRYTKYNLWVEVSGSGQVFFDQVTLFPTDCIDGKYNPETIRHFIDYGIKMIRWPGGNYTSGYNWKNGIGNWIDRPCLYNKAWGGLDSNFLGTDEIVRFCELVGAELVMGVGYNESLISVQDIVDWVEYCNGTSSTAYGSIRAENGNINPYGIKYWGIGNEVYGEYQLGHVSSSTYASGLSSISSQLRQIDNDIVIIASGRGVHNQYRGAYSGWTENLYSSASSAFDVLDCHLYVYGFEESVGYTADQFFRIYAASALNLRDFLAAMRSVVPGKKIAFMEWGVLPSLSGNEYSTPQRQTFANLLLTACQYHEMLRNCDIVSLSAVHNFSFYVAPQRIHSEPVNVRTELFKEMTELIGGYCIPVNESGIPKYNQDIDMIDVGIRQNVPEIDIVAVCKGNHVYLSCVNRSVEHTYSIDFDINGVDVSELSGKIYTSSQPYERNRWNNPVDYTLTEIGAEEMTLIDLPPQSYAMIKLNIEYPEAQTLLDSYESNGESINIVM